MLHEIERVIDALTSKHFNRREFLGVWIASIVPSNAPPKRLATFNEKQDFLNPHV
ncbi:MAG UNVERIFIED_CONTAM: hypothetical protein LVT10_26005 [Anaerolineae bacterium]